MVFVATLRFARWLAALVVFLALGAPAVAADAAAGPMPAAQVVCPLAAPCPPNDQRYFPQTGYRVDVDQFWNYYLRRGGLPTFGYPVSRTVTFLGFRTQFFQRQIMQLWPDGSVHLLNLLDSGLMPYTTFNYSTFPGVDTQLVAQAPSPSDPNYAADAIAFVRANAPSSWNGLPVNFANTYFRTVTPAAAFPGQPAASPQVQALLPLIQLEVWGLPTSLPAYDPNNHGFVYLRWQRGVMMYNTACNCTEGVLFGDYFKSILMNRNLPADLAQEAAGSPYFAQYAPDQPNWVARPGQLPNTNLTDAFVPEPRPLPAAQDCGGIRVSGASGAVADSATAAAAESCFFAAYQQCAPAVLTETAMGVDTGVVRTLSIAKNSGACVVTDQVAPYAVPPRPLATSTYTCSGVSQQANELQISGCGADGDVLIPKPAT